MYDRPPTMDSSLKAFFKIFVIVNAIAITLEGGYLMCRRRYILTHQLPQITSTNDLLPK